MSAWIGNRTAMRSASRTSVGWSRCVRHAAHAVAHVMSPTITATYRWSAWASYSGRTIASVSGPIGISTPFISGQSVNTSAAFEAVTCEPNSSSA